MLSSTVRVFAGQEKDPSAATLLPDCRSNGIGTVELRNQKEMEIQKQKKREADRRYRQNKKKEVKEMKNKLAMTIFENENLKSSNEKLQQENIQLTGQLKSIEIRPETKFAELIQEIKNLRIENEIITSNMTVVQKEKEELKIKIEHKEVIIAALTEKLGRV